MHSWVMVLGIAAGAATAGADTLATARAAQARVGAERWSRVIRIENENRGGPYPADFHALVFEMGGVLWFYTDTDGTQSFSVHRGRLAEEKADFGRLLREIDPGFVRHEEVGARFPRAPVAMAGELPYGCFMECLAYHDRRAAAGPGDGGARLLTYYTRGRDGLQGHTVLLFPEGAGWWVFDPAEPGRLREVSGRRLRDPMALAWAVMPSVLRPRLDRAVFTGISPPGPGSPRPRPLFPLVAFGAPGGDPATTTLY